MSVLILYIYSESDLLKNALSVTLLIQTSINYPTINYIIMKVTDNY